jgi:hypothetical protein
MMLKVGGALEDGVMPLCPETLNQLITSSMT